MCQLTSPQIDNVMGVMKSDCGCIGRAFVSVGKVAGTIPSTCQSVLEKYTELLPAPDGWIELLTRQLAPLVRM